MERWTKEEMEYLWEKYPETETYAVADRLNRSELAVRMMAHKLGIRKKEFPQKRREKPKVKKRTERKRYNPNPITPLTCKMVCWYTEDGESVEQISKYTHRPMDVIQEILEDCLADGRYEKYNDKRRKSMLTDARETGRLAEYMKQR